MIIRICTENKNREQVRIEVDKYFDCYSLFQGVGMWNGQVEHSLLIEIAMDANADQTDHTIARAAALELADDIKILNNQEAVLVEFLQSENVMV